MHGEWWENGPQSELARAISSIKFTAFHTKPQARMANSHMFSFSKWMFFQSFFIIWHFFGLLEILSYVCIYRVVKVSLSETVPKLFGFIPRRNPQIKWNMRRTFCSLNNLEVPHKVILKVLDWAFESLLLIRIQFDSTRFVWIRSKEHFDKWYFGFWKADKSNWLCQMVREIWKDFLGMTRKKLLFQVPCVRL